ncbi:glycoside hydrolase 43 family protein [Pedobacter gandavensis]|uniref:glycoside hydrolase family 43 protein n=1 Tax=Pedobacter gandavensis TaxID=2679963 RepID=UPI002479626B|nr:glycoside hydrolase 43 family protein [Pedobacter gandavensis]WGQ10353.1 glycoside hydrolase 43 family protein [Pedobacter gandavensis]
MEAETIIKNRPLWRSSLWMASFLLCGGTVMAQAPKDVKGSVVKIGSTARERSVSAKTSISKVWVADLGNGKYKNPILNADYSDPDAIRVGDDYYMIASSFDGVPGLPILHSKDLVNWSIIGHALTRQIPEAHFSKTQHGNGVWAPAIRYHKGEFYIYYPDPDFGIYLIKAKDPRGEWSAPVMVAAGKGLIDPCPLWDEDGKVYLAYAYAGSRAGIKSVLAVKRLNEAGDRAIDQGQLVYDGHEDDPTIEGPKFYKRNGYYYLFAPAGGVATGWQLVLRSKNVYGPYERKVVMDQGKSPINGPHQGAWVDTPGGEDWFLHFQDKGVYGRVVHLQPMKWIKDWPVIGIDPAGTGIGTPVLEYKKPAVAKVYPITTPAESDEFNENRMGLQWQWQANPEATWAFMNPGKGSLRLFTQAGPEEMNNYWEVPNLLLQKFPAEEFMATAKITFNASVKLEEEKVGLIIMGRSYANLALKSNKGVLSLVYTNCMDAAKGKREQEIKIADWKEVLAKEKIKGNFVPPISHVQAEDVYLRVQVKEGAVCTFSYSLDGKDFKAIPGSFQAEEGQWIGAKMGLFAVKKGKSNDSGYVDLDWFRVEPIK